MMPDIDETDLRRVDLNLLVIFVALMSERSATNAGRQLRMSQPAVSGALSRLRRVFHDPLFIRAPGGLSPTPRAVELARQLTPALRSLAAVVRDPDASDARSGKRVFTLGMSDDIEAFIMPPLIGGLLMNHSHVRVNVRQTNRHVVTRMLDQGEIDLAIAVAPTLTAAHRHEPLFQSSYCSVLDPRRLHAALPLNLADFIEHPHVLVSYDGRRGIVDDLLDARGLQRHIAASTTHFAGVVPLLKSLGALATIPEHAARVFARDAGLALTPVPIDMPLFTVSLVWHELRTADPQNVWLRRRLHDAVAAARSLEPGEHDQSLA